MKLSRREMMGAVIGAIALPGIEGLAADTPTASATLRIMVGEQSPHPIPTYITGKFAEHLGSNIYNGMCAQVVRNCTFAEFPFWTSGQDPDGRPRILSDEDRILAEIRRNGARLNWPQAEIQKMIEARADGLAHWWVRIGNRGEVRVSPDTGPHGGRAQRIEVKKAGQGIAQWMYLPLHRVRKYEYQMVVRSPDLTSLSVSLADGVASAADGIGPAWRVIHGTLDLPATATADALHRLAITAPAGGMLVIDRFMLWPADHIHRSDPDVIAQLKESKLPILRWPGGNFVSGYHWEDGVGPIEQRPTRRNEAWGSVEPNLFGTDEFIAFCRSVGCEPMICVNGGDGTPEEAARWIEYCNGSKDTPMGARRAANGHPEPFNVRHWEVGNELWGRWQVYWTTPRGNADRYRRFVPAMLKADPTIKLYACGAPVLWGRDWNLALFREAGEMVRCTTDHPLIGGNVSPSVDPLDVHRDFMAVPLILERKWAELRKDMLAAGIKDPKLAVTELQLFAHIAEAQNRSEPVRLTRRNLVNPGTQAEALYDILIYHTAIRLAPFVEMVTQSATVNHGGGLRKDRERVYANPCHYAQAAFAAFAGATPVSVQLQCPEERNPVVLPDIRGAGPAITYGRVAALAAIAMDGSLLISLVHRGTEGPVRLKIELNGFKSAAPVNVWELTADVPWAANTLEQPRRVAPATSQIKGSALAVEISPFTIMQLRVPPAP